LRVEALGAIPVTQPLQGLGFTLNPQNDWEFKMAAAAGATHVRFQCGWQEVEIQTPPPGNTTGTPQFALNAPCVAGLKSAATYGLHPTILAAYGSPYHRILTVTVPGGASAGANVLGVQFATGNGGDTLASLRSASNTILPADGSALTKHHSYAGSLITGSTLTDAAHANLTLASALTAALPASTDTQYIIQEYLYPPAATFSANDPSVLAYARYAEYLAACISRAGLTGDVEIWNEPPWNDDPWDERADFYDVFHASPDIGPRGASLPNWGFVAALQSQVSPVPGVTYIWGGTNKSGSNSVLDSQMILNTGVPFKQPATIVTSESFHPYGNTPEDALWSAPCLAATIKPDPSAPSDFYNCNLFGLGPNLALAAQQSLIQRSHNPTWGIAHSITETGFEGALGDDLHKTRFIMRQFLGFQAAGVSPLDFYRLYDNSDDNFSFVSQVANAHGQHTPLPAYNALKCLMSDLASIGGTPVTPYGLLPAPVSYAGTYPLDTVHIVGHRKGNQTNSVLLALWQRSNGANWYKLASPPQAVVVVSVPIGMTPVQATNLDTRVPVPYTWSNQQVTFMVSDDPIGLLFESLGGTPH
jgi:hypothetical protein